ncbi:Uma2 family endonuclease [Spirulina subsalsa FACHB-351]|uniref:Uma2 family endonuclease n=1 Tax=Spirulina subsalsa FACHB-351 TaxID=234711 RepID=A0ABT3L600_9CYAN|nr:Uma2 family endonuclease [Spirulina subsalsa]MCW6036612.1 Uma2 family endonuclease [Spirulina subsalsa FACHB-351]
MSLTLEQLQRMQSFCPDYRMGLIGGEVVVMSPSGFESDEVAAEFVRQLGNWVRGRGLGRVTASGAGFLLPNGDMRSPDVSFCRIVASGI